MTEESITTDAAVDAGPFAKPGRSTVEQASIVDTLLDLDEFLSGDIRLAEKTAYFTTEPQLEAELDELEAQLAEITDEFGNPVEMVEASVADGTHPALALANEIEAKRALLNKSRRGVRVRQLPSDEWLAFRAKNRKIFEDPNHAGRQAMWNELIVACAIAPAFTIEKIQEFRKKIGDPQVAEIEAACFHVCTKSGVSVPKSPLSSLVLKRQARETS